MHSFLEIWIISFIKLSSYKNLINYYIREGCRDIYDIACIHLCNYPFTYLASCSPHPPIYLSLPTFFSHPAIYPSIHPCIHFIIYPSINLPIVLFLNSLSIHLSIYPLCIYSSSHLLICPSFYLLCIYSLNYTFIYSFIHQ